MPDGRAQRADSGMPEIISIRALIFATDSSFWMAAMPEGRARRVDSDMYAKNQPHLSSASNGTNNKNLQVISL